MEKISLNIFANCYKEEPDIDILIETYLSFIENFGEIKTRVYLDPNPYNKFQEYKELIQAEIDCEVIKTKGLADGYLLSLKNKEDYLFQLEFDWEFQNINYTLEELVQLMEKDKIYNLRFPVKLYTPKNYKEGYRQKYITRAEEKGDKIKYLLTDEVSNQPHIINREYYLKNVKGIKRDGASFGIEENLNKKYDCCILGGWNNAIMIKTLKPLDRNKMKPKTSKPKAIILASGIDKEINNTPRQLLELDGEPILHRTIRQLKERDYDIAITVPSSEYYGNLGIREIVGNKGKAIEKILNLKNEVPCLAVLGDVYFTDEAMDIMTENGKGIMFFGRTNAGIIKKCGEIFAIRVTKSLVKKAQELKDLGKKSPLRRCGEWELYRLLNNIPLNTHKTTKHWTEINDLTDDIDNINDYNRFLTYFKERFPSHIIVTRMHYEKEEDLLERIKTYKENLLPALLKQKNQNFNIGILCNPKHKDIVQEIHQRIIPFFTNKKGIKKGKYWSIMVKWEDIYGLNKYDIQTNLDSDDLISKDFTQVIVDSLKEKVSTYICFQPEVRDMETGNVYKMTLRCEDGYKSPMYSLYQPNKENYIYIGQDSHTVFSKYAKRKVVIPEGHVFLNIHDKNDSSTMVLAQGFSKVSVNYNIMAHESRKEFIPYLQDILGDAEVIWDKENNCLETRIRCLEHHIKSGKEYGITIQDDAILADNFKKKAEDFINSIGEEAVYNFYYKKGQPEQPVTEAVRSGKNYIKERRLWNEIGFAMPVKLMQEMIDYLTPILKRGSKKDWQIQYFLTKKKIPVYFSLPSLVDHRIIPSILNRSTSKQRTALWFSGDWKVEEFKKPGPRTTKTPARGFKLEGEKIVPK